MNEYTIWPDNCCDGNWLVINPKTRHINSSHRTREAAEQCLRILNGSHETWTNGEELPTVTQ